MELFSGGYIFVLGAPRPGYVSAELLPETLWSPSECICARLPSVDYSEGEIRVEPAPPWLDLASINDGQLLRALKDSFDDDWYAPSVFPTLQSALSFAERFLRAPNTPGLRLFGLGLPGRQVDPFLADVSRQVVLPGNAHYNLIRRGALLAPGGTALGFEPLGYEEGGFHSYLCNSLEADLEQRFGLRPNATGRFDSLQACEDACSYIRQDSTGAEPVPWHTWAVHEYRWFREPTVEG